MPGEDPLLTGEYGAYFVKAAQGRSVDGQAQRVVCAPEHWLDYDLVGRHDAFSPGWGPSRNDFDARVSKQEQAEYFLPAWHATVKFGQPGGVMCSTNRINGVDACMNPTYAGGGKRSSWGWGSSQQGCDGSVQHNGRADGAARLHTHPRGRIAPHCDAHPGTWKASCDSASIFPGSL